MTTRFVTLCIALSLLAAAACGRDDLTVREENPQTPNDYHRTDLREAVAELAKTPASAAAYRRFADRVTDLRPEFDDTVKVIAERNLVFRALPVLEAVRGQPLAKQMEVLATTVWPVALGVLAKKGESARAYLDRACGGPLALDCKRIVHEYRPVMIGAMVWNKLKDRAREALRLCNECKGDKGYTDAVALYGKRDEEAGAAAGKAADHAHPRAWPVAGSRSRPWSNAPVFTLRSSGTVLLDGVEAKGRWLPIMKRARTDAAVLGVHLKPSARVRTLRALLADARAAEYRQVALQVRVDAYPYELREYRISTDKRRGTRVKVRDVDTIQVLVQALDAMTRVAGKDPVLRL